MTDVLATCPLCGGPAVDVRCWRCTARLDTPEARELSECNADWRRLESRRSELGAIVASTRGTSPASAPTSPPAPSPASPHPAWGATATPRPAAGLPEITMARVRTILLALGAVMVSVASVAYFSVRWPDLSTGQRIGIIGAVSVALIVGSVLLRKAYPATAEAVGAIALAMVFADVIGADRLGLLSGMSDRVVLALALAAVGVVAVGLGAAGLVVARVALVVLPISVVVLGSALDVPVDAALVLVGGFGVTAYRWWSVRETNSQWAPAARAVSGYFTVGVALWLALDGIAAVTAFDAEFGTGSAELFAAGVLAGVLAWSDRAIASVSLSTAKVAETLSIMSVMAAVALPATVGIGSVWSFVALTGAGLVVVAAGIQVARFRTTPVRTALVLTLVAPLLWVVLQGLLLLIAIGGDTAVGVADLWSGEVAWGTALTCLGLGGVAVLRAVADRRRVFHDSAVAAVVALPSAAAFALSAGQPRTLDYFVLALATATVSLVTMTRLDDRVDASAPRPTVLWPFAVWGTATAAVALLCASGQPVLQAIAWSSFTAAMAYGVVRNRGRSSELAVTLVAVAAGSIWTTSVVIADAIDAQAALVGPLATVVGAAAALGALGFSESRTWWNPVAVTSLIVGVVALGAAADEPAAFAAVGAVLASAVLSLAVRRERAVWVVPAAVLYFGSWLMYLTTRGDNAVELVSLPLAVLMLSAGAWMLVVGGKRDSLQVVGPALVVGLGPSTLVALADGGTRVVIVALVAGALVGLGAVRAWRAPIIVGSVVLALISADTLATYAVGVWRWAVIGATGAALLIGGAVVERRARRRVDESTTSTVE